MSGELIARLNAYPKMKAVLNNLPPKMLALSANVSIVLGQTRGTTCLPLPPVNDGTGDGMGKVGSAKDRTHTLEGAIITWTRQIKGVLKMDPESALKQGLHRPFTKLTRLRVS